MSQSRPSLTASIRGRDPRPPSGEHPNPDMLVAYHTQELAEPDRERMQDHLVQCSGCARAILDLANFSEIEADDPTARLSEEEVGRELQRFHGQVLERDGFAAPPAALPSPNATAPPPQGSWRQRSWGVQAIAATMALMSLGLLFRLYVVEGQNATLRQPRGVGAEVHLEASAGQRGNPLEPVASVEEGEPLVAYLGGYDLEPYDAYEAELTTVDGTTVHGPITLHAEAGSSMLVWFPVAPAAGTYRIELRGNRAGQLKPIRTYSLRVVYRQTNPNND